MADFGIGSQSGGDSGGGGFEDPGASSFGGQDAFDPSALGMGGGGWSPFGGGGGGGGGFGGASSPSQTAGTAFDPAAQSAQQANQQQQQQQPNKPPSRGSQLEDAIKSLFGGAQHAMSPSLQSLASTARTGMGWFNNAAKSTATPDALSPTPSDQGPINDPSTAIGDLPSGGTGSPSQDVHDMMGDLRKMFGLQAPQAQTAGASTGPTGNEATQAAQEPAGGPAGGATGDFTPAAVPQLAPPADPAAQVGAAQQDPAAAAAPPAPDTSSAATPPPQSAPTSGENNQPGPGDQVTGSASSAAAAGTGGQYAPGSQQWQSNPAFALLDLLRGDFGSFMKDLMGQQGVPPGQNRAGAPRPPQYGQAPGFEGMNGAGMRRQAAQGPAATQGITDPFTAGVPAQGTLPATAKAGPPSGTPSAGNPAGSSAAATGASTPPPAAQPAAPLGTRPAAPVPQASAAQRAALGLDPAATSGAPAATNAPPAATAGSPDAPRGVPTTRVAPDQGQRAVNLGNGLPANAPLTPQNYNAYLDQVARIESGGNPNAVTGSNYGTYQFGPGEMQRYGITNWRDPAQQRRAMQLETNENTQILRRTLGRDPTPGELYLTHQQGQAGGPALISAAQRNPNMPAYQAIQRYYRNPQIAMTAIHGNIPSNNPLRGVPASQVTAKQFVDMWNARFNRGYRGTEVAAQ